MSVVNNSGENSCGKGGSNTFPKTRSSSTVSSTSDAGSLVEIDEENYFGPEELVVDHRIRKGGDGGEEGEEKNAVQDAAAEFCIIWTVELSMAVASFVYAVVVSVQVSLSLPGSDDADAIDTWRGFSITSCVFLSVFCIEAILVVYAFGRSYLFQPSNFVETLVTVVALGLEVAICTRLFQDVSSSSLERGALTTFDNLTKLTVVLLRMRRFQEIMVTHANLLWCGRGTQQDEVFESLESKKVVDMMGRLRRKYPLTVRESQEINWACFLIASHKLYGGFDSSSSIMQRNEQLFDGLDEETAEWVMNTYTSKNVRKAAGEGENRGSSEASTKGLSSPVLGTRADGINMVVGGGFSLNDSALDSTNSLEQGLDTLAEEDEGEELASRVAGGEVVMTENHVAVPPPPLRVTGTAAAANDDDVVDDDDDVDVNTNGHALRRSNSECPVRSKSFESDGDSLDANERILTRQTSGDSAGLMRSDLKLLQAALLQDAHVPNLYRKKRANKSENEAVGESHRKLSSDFDSTGYEEDEEDTFDEDGEQLADSGVPVLSKHESTSCRDLQTTCSFKKAKHHSRRSRAHTDVQKKLLAEHAVLKQVTWSQDELDEFNTAVDEWDFDIFKASDMCGGRPLCPVMICVLRKNGLFEEYPSLRQDDVLSLFTAVESGYRVENPYHNRIHAADVLQTTHYFMTHKIVRDTIGPRDIFAALIAAAFHDFQHPGTTNSFLVATHDKLALRYNDRAVLEHMHVAAAFQLMRNKRCDILTCLGAGESYHEARETVIQMVLATDMTHHFEGLDAFNTDVIQHFDALKKTSNTHVRAGASNSSAADIAASSTDEAMLSPIDGALAPLTVRRTLLKTTLHCADVSNPAKIPKLCQNWAMLVQEEFFRQGDKEREYGIKISMFMDRHKPAFHKCQIGFINVIVKPLFNTYCRFVVSLQEQVDWCLSANLKHWEKKQAEEEQLHATPSSPKQHHPPLGTTAKRGTSFKLGNRIKSSLHLNATPSSFRVKRHRSGNKSADLSSFKSNLVRAHTAEPSSSHQFP